MSDDLTVLGPDGIRRSYDEHYDTMMDVKQDPTGALWAIQAQATRIKELEAKLAKVKASFRRNMMQAYPKYTYERFYKDFDEMLKGDKT